MSMFHFSLINDIFISWHIFNDLSVLFKALFLEFIPLTSSWVHPVSDLNRFPTKPSKTIGPPGKPEGNDAHRVHNAVSLEIDFMGD
jgi:hypothetical protein